MLNATQPFVSNVQFVNFMPMGLAHDAGLIVTGGSDWPVTQISPLASIEVAVTGGAVPYHLGMQTQENQPIMPGERVSLDTMIRAYTLNAAYASMQDDIIGSVTVGKRADLVVLEKNLFEIPPAEINEVPVSLTMVDGNIVYQSESSIPIFNISMSNVSATSKQPN
jgi:predicted amidohydrolase YtcJ